MDIRTQVPLDAYSTFHIGGPADYFVDAQSVDDIKAAIAFARERTMPWHVIGGGSNILFADDGVRGLVIKNSIETVTYDERDDGLHVVAGAGAMLDDVVGETVRRGFFGMENLSAIPGTIGAAPVQNVGAYGTELAPLVTSILVYDAVADTVRTLLPADCRFAYRHSIFKESDGSGLVVLAVELVLPRSCGPNVRYADLNARFGGVEAGTLTAQVIRDAVIEIRAGKFPDWHVVGTAGSFFTNPVIDRAAFETLHAAYPDMSGYPNGDTVKVPLGWILDHVCGMRGVHEGKVGTYERQALVIVAERGATATDVTAFAQKIATCVYERTNVRIEWEVTYKK